VFEMARDAPAADEYVGLTLPEATEKAQAQGKVLRDLSESRWLTADRRSDRVNLRLDAAGRVTDAAWF
jgi:hypothetical protein